MNRINEVMEEIIAMQIGKYNMQKTYLQIDNNDD